MARPLTIIHLEPEGSEDGGVLCGTSDTEHFQLAALGADAEEPTPNEEGTRLCQRCLASWRRRQQATTRTDADVEDDRRALTEPDDAGEWE